MHHIVEISDLSNPDLQIYRNLTQGDPQSAGHIFLAESEKVIQYALHAGCRPLSFLMERQFIPQLDLLNQLDQIPVFTGSRDIIRGLTGYTLDRGFLCAMERPVFPELKALYQNANRIAILQNISDPTDLGAIFRSAAALGMDAILIGPGCCDPLYRRSVRVSMGTVFQVPWTFLSDEQMPKGFTIVSITQHPGGKELIPSDWNVPRLAIIMDGSNPKDAYSIPYIPDSEPLNMAAASAVLFWMLRKR